MILTKKILRSIERGRDKIKKIETKAVESEFQKDSAWLIAVYDIVDRTALAIRDELEKALDKFTRLRRTKMEIAAFVISIVALIFALAAYAALSN